jgi:RNA polymerase sigma-70 factor (ECF subfamily)
VSAENVKEQPGFVPIRALWSHSILSLVAAPHRRGRRIPGSLSAGERPRLPRTFVSAVDRLRSLEDGLERAGHLRLAARPEGPEGDAALVAGVRTHAAGARRDVVRQYGGLVRAILIRLLGVGEPERADLIQEVFLRVFSSIDGLEQPEAFKAWISRMTVFVAREHIRRKRRWRWFTLFGDPPDAPSPTAGEGVREAVRCVYAALDAMPVDERLIFTLHILHGLDLREAAPMCGLSYATARRRLASGQQRFLKLAGRYEALLPWMGQ